MTYDSREIEKGYAILAKGLELTDSQRQKRTDYLRMKAPKYEEVRYLLTTYGTHYIRLILNRLC